MLVSISNFVKNYIKIVASAYRRWKSSGPGFGPSGRDPNQPAPVPRRPLPNSGTGEVALPLPEQPTENTI